MQKKKNARNQPVLDLILERGPPYTFYPHPSPEYENETFLRLPGRVTRISRVSVCVYYILLRWRLGEQSIFFSKTGHRESRACDRRRAIPFIRIFSSLFPPFFSTPLSVIRPTFAFTGFSCAARAKTISISFS